MKVATAPRWLSSEPGNGEQTRAMRNIHLTPQLVRAVRDAVDVVAIASDHTKLTRRGKRYHGLCPLHKEKTPSFSCDPDQGLFYCFGCGAGGDAIKLHMLATGDDFPAAIEALAQRYGIPLPRVAEGPVTRRERGVSAALEAAHEFFRLSLSRSAVPRAYLEERRISPALVERFGLGYAPDGWRGLLEALDRKVPVADLEAAGLLARPDNGGQPYDRFRHRLMFPIGSPSGRLVGFGGRTLGDDRAKYVNSNETEEFHKGRLLYGLHLAKGTIRDRGSVVLVEGYFDVVGTVASGIEGVVASMGTALTAEQARLLARYCDEVVVAYDGDNAGENAFRRALPLLLAENLAVRRARFEGGHDPDSLRLAEGGEAVARVLTAAQDGVMLEIERLSLPAGAGPHAQAKAADEVAALLRAIPDAIVRRGYLQAGARRLGIPPELLARRRGEGEAPRQAAPAAPVPPPVRQAREVRTLEEQVLELLMAPGELPAGLDLPPVETFFDPVCRNIFRAFRALYTGSPEAPPESRDVIAYLAEQGDVSSSSGGSVDRVAQVLLESSVAPEKAALPARLDDLIRRWQERRLLELKAELEDAERRGDQVRFQQVLAERIELSKKHHRGPRRSG